MRQWIDQRVQSGQYANASDYMRDLIRHDQSRLTEPISKPPSESQLLQQINLGIPIETWQQYRQLIEKRQAETLTDSEQRTLIEMSGAIEVANARRMAALVQLATLQRKSIPTLMAELGIQPNANA